MKRTPLLIVATVVVVVAAGTGIWLYRPGTLLGLPSAASSSKPSVSASVQEGLDAIKALQKLGSDPTLLVPTDQKSTVNIADAVPAGSKIRVESKSWAAASPKSGTLVATLSSPGQPSETYLVSMIKQGGRWVVVGTIPVNN